MWLNANRPAGSSNGWVSAKVSVESRDGRRRWTSAAVVSIAPTASRPGIVAEGADVAVRREAAVAVEPRGAPAEPGDPEPLEPLGERPQLVEPERLRGPGDVVLAHRAR